MTKKLAYWSGIMAALFFLMALPLFAQERAAQKSETQESTVPASSGNFASAESAASEQLAASMHTPASSEGRLEILDMGPRGTLESEMHPLRVYVQFAKPMVALSAVGREVESISRYLIIEPALEGRARWYGTSLLQFEAKWDSLKERAPADSLPIRSYQVTVPAGVQSLDGSVLEQSQSWSFQLEPLLMQWVRAGSVYNLAQEDIAPAAFDQLYVGFNYPVDKDLVAKELRMYIGDRRVSFETYEVDEAEVLKEGGLDFPRFHFNPSMRSYVLRLDPKEPMPEQETLSLRLPRGAVLIAGSESSKTKQHLSLQSLEGFSRRGAYVESIGNIFDESFAIGLRIPYSHRLATKGGKVHEGTMERPPYVDVLVVGEAHKALLMGHALVIDLGYPHVGSLAYRVANGEQVEIALPRLEDEYGRGLEAEAGIKVGGEGALEPDLALAAYGWSPLVWPRYAYKAVLPAMSYGVAGMRSGYRKVENPFETKGGIRDEAIAALPLSPLGADELFFKFGLKLPSEPGSYEMKTIWEHPSGYKPQLELNWTVTDMAAAVYTVNDFGLLHVTSLETGEPISGVRARYFDPNLRVAQALGRGSAQASTQDSEPPSAEASDKGVAQASRRVAAQASEAADVQMSILLGETNNEGLLEFIPRARSGAKHYILLEKDDEKLIVPVEGSGWSNSWYGSPASYIMTDRKLYRPGEKLAIGGFLWRKLDVGIEADTSREGLNHARNAMNSATNSKTNSKTNSARNAASPSAFATSSARYVPRTGTVKIFLYAIDTGEELILGERKLSPEGGFDFSWAIPEDIELGQYRVGIRSESYLDDWQTITINEENPAEVIASIDAPEAIVRGDNFTAKLRGQSYSGAPLAGVRGHYKLYRGYSEDEDTTLTGDIVLGTDGSYELSIDAKKLNLGDDDSDAMLMLDFELWAPDGRIYEAESAYVSVSPAAFVCNLDPAELPATEGDAWRIDYRIGHDYFALAYPLDDVDDCFKSASGADDSSAEEDARSAEAYRSQRAKSVELEVWRMTPWGNKELVGSYELDPEQAYGSIDIARPAWGEILLLARTRDAHDRVWTTREYVYIASVQEEALKELQVIPDFPAHDAAAKLSADAKTGADGELIAQTPAGHRSVRDQRPEVGTLLAWDFIADKRARSILLIKTSPAGGGALPAGISYEVIKVVDGKARYSYTSTEEDYPGFRIQAMVSYAPSKTAKAACEKIVIDVPIASKAKELEIVVSAPETAEPGEEIVLDVKAEGGSELLVALVDKRRLDQTGHQLKNPLDTYYPYGAELDYLESYDVREHLVDLGFDFEGRYGAFVGASGVYDDMILARGHAAGAHIKMKKSREMALGAVAEAAPLYEANYDSAKSDGRVTKNEAGAIDLRDNFSALAYFKSGLVVDADGHKQIALTLPDDLTSYEVWVVGAKADRIGSARTTLAVQESLEARLYLPKALRLADEGEALLSLQNLRTVRVDSSAAARGEAVSVTGGEAVVGADGEGDSNAGSEGSEQDVLELSAYLLVDGAQIGPVQSLVLGSGETQTLRLPLPPLVLGKHKLEAWIEGAGMATRVLKAETEVLDLPLYEEVRTMGVVLPGAEPVVEHLLLGSETESLSYKLAKLPVEGLDAHITRATLGPEWASDALLDYMRALSYPVVAQDTGNTNELQAKAEKFWSFMCRDGAFIYISNVFDPSYMESAKVFVGLALVKDKEGAPRYEQEEVQRLVAYLQEEFEEASGYEQALVVLAVALWGKPELLEWVLRHPMRRDIQGNDAMVADFARALLTKNKTLLDIYASRLSYEATRVSFIDSWKEESSFLLLLYAFAAEELGVADEQLARMLASLVPNMTEEYRPLNIWHFLLRELMARSAYEGRVGGEFRAKQAVMVESSADAEACSETPTPIENDKKAQTIELPRIEGLGAQRVDFSSDCSGELRSEPGSELGRELRAQRAIAQDLELEIAPKANNEAPLFYEIGLRYERKIEDMQAREEGIGVYREIRDDEGNIVDELVAGKLYKMLVYLSAPRPRGLVRVTLPHPAGADSKPYFGLVGRLSSDLVLYLGNYSVVEVPFVMPYSGVYSLPPVTAFELAYPHIFGSSCGSRIEISAEAPVAVRAEDSARAHAEDSVPAEAEAK